MNADIRFRRRRNQMLQCETIKALIDQDKPRWEIIEHLERSFPAQELMNRARIYRWHRAFLNGRQDVVRKNVIRKPSPHPRSNRLRTPENIQRVAKLVEENPKVTIRDLAKMIGCHPRTMTVIVTQDLRLCRFDREFLTEYQVQVRQNAAKLTSQTKPRKEGEVEPKFYTVKDVLDSAQSQALPMASLSGEGLEELKDDLEDDMVHFALKNRKNKLLLRSTAINET